MTIKISIYIYIYINGHTMFILSGGGGDILNNMYRTSSCLILSALDGEKHNVIPKMCR